ncbi:MAG: RNA polymerase sigma factor, partial [Bacteroidales bacterium]
MQANVISDQDLIGKYLTGDESALETIIRRHKNRVFAYILMVVKDKELAEDLFQDTFIKVINTFRSGQYKEEGKFIQWVMRIAHNLIIDYFRKSKRIPIIENNDDYDIFDKVRIPVESVEEQLIMEQIHQDVKKLIEYLPVEQKEVLVMRHYGDMSFKDIA